MRIVIVGYGVQGRKRWHAAQADSVGIADPVVQDANWNHIADVPLEAYDAAFVCTPDEPKMEILRYLLRHGKHALIEKPLHAASEADFDELERLACASGAVCYTAYNHRFEPHYVRMRDLLRSGELGRIYRCRMFYGNGTARLVRDSAWRDRGAGVLTDLGSHLLDTARYWFGEIGEDFRVVSANRFENRAPDHVVIDSQSCAPHLELEMTLLSWRNHFTCDVFAENGSAHIESLCKWGPTTFIRRRRMLPSGRPPEESVTVVQDDPTWATEYAHFKMMVSRHAPIDLTNDRWMFRVLNCLSADAMRMAKSS